MTVSIYCGKNDLEEYVDWEKSMDNWFECHNYSEQKKVIVATIEFTSYASIWWKQQRRSQERNGAKIHSWAMMKRLMRNKFVPSWYQRDLHNRIHSWKQDNMTIGDYDKEISILTARPDLVEDEEVKVYQLLGGLHREDCIGRLPTNATFKVSSISTS
ncbi:hypothetical protein LINGRAHAP2_LOCUS22930 [Linum grandiflorum]